MKPNGWWSRLFKSDPRAVRVPTARETEVRQRVNAIHAMPRGEEQDRAWEDLLQELSPHRIVWVDELPAVLGHECLRMREVIDSCAAGDGLPESEVKAMTQCRWCGASLPERKGVE